VVGIPEEEDKQMLIVPRVNNKKFRETLKSYINDGHKVSKNPFVISSYQQEEIIILDIDDKDNIIVEKPTFNTYGASVNKIRLHIFKERLTIPLCVFEEMKTITDYNKVATYFGDSIEKTLWLKTLHDREDETT
jgi:hypothetical protein